MAVHESLFVVTRGLQEASLVREGDFNGWGDIHPAPVEGATISLLEYTRSPFVLFRVAASNCDPVPLAARV